MGYIELEKSLAEKQRKRRITLALCAVLSFALFFFAICMREASKEVTIVNDYWFYQSETVEYNESWWSLIIPSIFASIYLFILLLVDLSICGYKTFEKDAQHITIYRGNMSSVVFVDGKEVGRIEPLSYDYIIETILSSGVKVIISFPQRKVLFGNIHVFFSDNTPSLEL